MPERLEKKKKAKRLTSTNKVYFSFRLVVKIGWRNFNFTCFFFLNIVSQHLAVLHFNRSFWDLFRDSKKVHPYPSMNALLSMWQAKARYSVFWCHVALWGMSLLALSVHDAVQSGLRDQLLTEHRQRQRHERLHLLGVRGKFFTKLLSHKLVAENLRKFIAWQLQTHKIASSQLQNCCLNWLQCYDFMNL